MNVNIIKVMSLIFQKFMAVLIAVGRVQSE